MDTFARSMASNVVIVFLIGTAIGSVLPEFGNLVAKKLGLWAHSYNALFLIAGIVGIGVALYLGYKCRGS